MIHPGVPGASYSEGFKKAEHCYKIKGSLAASSTPNASTPWVTAPLLWFFLVRFGDAREEKIRFAREFSEPIPQIRRQTPQLFEIQRILNLVRVFLPESTLIFNFSPVN